MISIAGYMYNIYKTKTFFRYLLRSLCHQENPLVQVNHPHPETKKIINAKLKLTCLSVNKGIKY